jgi:thiol:disulfide interchange protein
MLFKRLLFFGLLLLGFSTFAQIQKPAIWNFDYQPKNSKVGDIIELKFTAKIDDGWYLYSSDFDPELGPIVTSMSFVKSPNYSLVDGIKPIHPKKKFDEIWQGDITYFTKKAQFIQKVKVLKENFKIDGTIEGQTCTEKDGQCIPLKEKFLFEISAKPAEIEKTDTTSLATVSKINELVDSSSKLNSKNDSSSIQFSEDSKTIKPEKPESEDSSLFGFLITAFIAGFLSIFMPCIYPIMPMTVSFFTKQKNGKFKAILYGIFIMAIFAIFGLIAKAFGQGFPNFLSTHWIPNAFFFVLFIVFGISLLGAFEIVLPHSFVNSVDKASDRGGILGIFFMAFTLVLVSFSCTAPFVGSLLSYSVQGEVWRPLYGMLAYGLPFALVFSLLAIFPGYLKSLPKSGGWMGELKVVFGLMEFALALKFLSTIDLVYHFNLIHRNVFLVIWIVIGIIITLYILGIVRMPKDKKVEKYHWSRILFSMLFFVFTLYMVPGVTNKSLDLLSGILPPLPKNVNQESAKLDDPKMSVLVHDLVGFGDFDDAKEYAKKVNKPILIDFTGHGCANCRKMEENVWVKPAVLQSLKNDFVIASLYVDDKKVLPKEKQYVSKFDNELKQSVGDKNMDLEITKFNNNAQPFYVIVNSNGDKLLEPIGYTSEADFKKFLENGKAAFK